MNNKWFLIISAVMCLSASIIIFLAVLKIQIAINSINEIIKMFYERADIVLSKIRSTQKQFGENTDKTTDLITSLGDIRKTIITIGNFRSQLSDLSNIISKINKPVEVGPSVNPSLVGPSVKLPIQPHPINQDKKK
jgi:predicted PurR-regulated permease PerM